MNYHVFKQGTWVGPFSTDDVKKMIRTNGITIEDYVCQEGTQDTVQIKSVPDLMTGPRVIPPPPLPPQKKKSWLNHSPIPKVVVILTVLWVVYIVATNQNTKNGEEGTMYGYFKCDGGIVLDGLKVTSGQIIMTRIYTGVDPAPPENTSSGYKVVKDDGENTILTTTTTEKISGLIVNTTYALIYDKAKDQYIVGMLNNDKTLNEYAKAIGVDPSGARLFVRMKKK